MAGRSIPIPPPAPRPHVGPPPARAATHAPRALPAARTARPRMRTGRSPAPLPPSPGPRPCAESAGFPLTGRRRAGPLTLWPPRPPSLRDTHLTAYLPTASPALASHRKPWVTAAGRAACSCRSQSIAGALAGLPGKDEAKAASEAGELGRRGRKRTTPPAMHRG